MNFILIVFLIAIVNCSNHLPKSCRYLPNNCYLISNKYHGYNFSQSKYICKKLEANFTFTQAQLLSLQKCKFDWLIVYYKLRNSQILDKRFDLQGLIRFGRRTLNPTSFYDFKHIRGFDVDSFPDTIEDYVSGFWMFYSTRFEFYLKGNRIRSCSDLKTTPRSLFHAVIEPDSLAFFVYAQIRYPICPLILRNFSFRNLQFNGFIHTFYKKNVLSFTNESSEMGNNINSRVNHLELSFVENIRIDSTLLNKLAFKNIQTFTIEGLVREIEKGVFKPFDKLITISLYPEFLRNLFHK